MKCVIAGSRTITNYDLVKSVFMNALLKDKVTEIVSGNAKGVDFCGERLAFELDLPLSRFPANWKLGRSAGHQRNKRMAEYADIALIIMNQGGSAGSLNMIENMKVQKKPYIVYEITEEGEAIEKRN